MHPLFHPLFVQFVIYFNEHEDFFECHEVLEEYWKEIAPKDKTHPLTAWILLSTGMYHWRRGNFNGAKRSLAKSYDRFHLNGTSAFYEGINFSRLIVNLEQSLESIENNTSFQPFKIQVDSSELSSAILQQPALEALTGDQLIHKHMLRDRSEILNAREEKRRNRH
ncbi:DUF309 domain-containing protein [Paenisporosarcina sp. FSL H8-0542]|uniref:DUF309 domain-containing protein n=1 Tax=unclassified Paenisporosarcina TaxID=2642018 RepID=UPI00034E0838|nr:DUF309 domain-containing protein [Paenisporosarcina sp. HGH0030]EPD53213.1 hypothetical protein HMPREF1210_00944 [Paenisporosarcina sp. HGH0030]